MVKLVWKLTKKLKPVVNPIIERERAYIYDAGDYESPEAAEKSGALYELDNMSYAIWKHWKSIWVGQNCFDEDELAACGNYLDFIHQGGRFV